MANNLQKGSGGPMRLYVGSLHCNITKEMLRGIFEPFGKVGWEEEREKGVWVCVCVDPGAPRARPWLYNWGHLFLSPPQIDSIVLMRDQDTGQSKGYGFITVSCGWIFSARGRAEIGLC